MPMDQGSSLTQEDCITGRRESTCTLFIQIEATAQVVATLK